MFARLFLTVLFFLSMNVCAQDFSLSTWAKSQYLGANGAIFEDRPVLQTEVSVSHENCWVSVWLSTAGDAWKYRGGDEIDYNASCNWKVGDATVSLLVAYYDLAMPGGASDVTIIFEKGSYFGKVSSFATHGLPFPGGEIVRAGRRFDLGTFHGWDLGASAEVAYDLGSFGFEEGLFGKLSFSGSRVLSETTRLSSGFDFADGITVSDRHGEFAVSVGVSRSF
jgi:hypothetical protein